MANNVIQNVINNRNDIMRIMSMDSNGTMDQMVKNRLQEGTLTYGENGPTYTPKAQQVDTRMVSGPIPPGRLQTSKLPQAILESFANNPIADAPLPEGCGGSVLDSVKFAPVQDMKQPAQMTMEQAATQSPIIDYSLIKTIVNEAVEEKVKKYVSAMAKKLINEGVGSVAGAKVNNVISLGDKFQFCDGEGNLYKATLKFKKNIKNKLNG